MFAGDVIGILVWVTSTAKYSLPYTANVAGLALGWAASNRVLQSSCIAPLTILNSNPPYWVVWPKPAWSLASLTILPPSFCNQLLTDIDAL